MAVVRDEARPRDTRAWVVLAVTAVAVVVQHLAVADASPWAASDVLLLTVVGLVVVSAARVASWSVAVPLRTETGAPARGIDDPPVVRNRATDPEHHPLAPRAPGPA